MPNITIKIQINILSPPLVLKIITVFVIRGQMLAHGWPGGMNLTGTRFTRCLKSKYEKKEVTCLASLEEKNHSKCFNFA